MSESLEAQSLRCAKVLDTRPGLPLLGDLVARAVSLGYRLRGHERYDDYLLERVEGMPILVMPSVFNPKLLRSGAYFASQLGRELLGTDSDVLDMGTGSGVCALSAARHARRVVAVDINPAAVRCARINALMNQLEQRVEVRHGDLFAPVSGERFDRILFNPPFKRGAAASDRDRAWRASDVAERFAAGIGAHLAPRGCALVLLSTYGDAAGFFGELTACGFSMSLVAAQDFVGERLAIFRAQLP